MSDEIKTNSNEKEETQYLVVNSRKKIEIDRTKQ